MLGMGLDYVYFRLYSYVAAKPFQHIAFGLFVTPIKQAEILIEN